MSPQDQVERALKEIHVYFSKCEPYEKDPSRIIVDQRAFIALLEKLNLSIYAMLEKYEQTRQRAGEIERSARREGERMIADAESRADDVYAASLIYMDEMIQQIKNLMDRTTDQLNDAVRNLRRDLRDQKTILQSHETQLHASLADAADTKKYLAIIEEENRKREQKKQDLEEQRLAGKRYLENLRGAAGQGAVPDRNAFDGIAKKDTKTGRKLERSMSVSHEKAEVFVNKESEYFKRKAAKNALAEEKPDDLPILDLEEIAQAAKEKQAEMEPVILPTDPELSDAHPGTDPNEVHIGEFDPEEDINVAGRIKDFLLGK